MKYRTFQKIGFHITRMAVLLFCTSAFTFFLLSASPVDPLQTNVGQAALGAMSPEQVAKLREYWGVGVPPIQRFWQWVMDLLHGDMGTSLLYRQPVLQVIGVRLSNSLGLLITAWIISGAAGLFLGVLAGKKQGSPMDRIITSYAVVTASTPAFWLALVLLMIFAVWLQLLPIGLSVPIGMESSFVTLWDRIVHGLLPAVTLSITGISTVALHTRQKMAEVMDSDFVLYARARGETEWQIVRRHGLRNILMPAITLQFASISEIIGGSVLVEQVFSYPGLGQAAVAAGLGGDVPLLLGITVITSAMVFTGNMAANLLYGAVDPRIRRGEQKR